MRLPLLMLTALIILLPLSARAACTGPAGEAGTIIYNVDHQVTQFCNSATWIAMTGDSLWTSTGSDIHYTGGNVGIGTGTPRQKLDVLGTVLAGETVAANGALGFGINYTTADIVNTFGSHYSSIATTLGYGVRPKNGAAGFVSSAGNSSFTKGALMLTNQLVFSNAPAATIAVGSDVAMTERFRVDASGRVGIGTSSPASLVHIASASPIMIVQDNDSLKDTNAVLGYISFRDSAGTEYGWVGEGSAGANYIGLYDNRAAGQIQLGTNSSTRLTILSNGNVGIGTVAPVAALTVEDGSGQTQVGVLSDSTAYGAIGFGTSLTSANYALAGDGSYTLLNVPSGGSLHMRVGNTNYLNMTSAGYVGIGAAGAAISQKLTVSGNVLANQYLHPSDERLKANIVRVQGLNTVMQLRGVSFDWKSSGKASAGVIAQDVEAVMPQAVTTGPDGMKSVEYDQIIAPLIEAVKELHARTQVLEAANDNLHEKIDSLTKEAH